VFKVHSIDFHTGAEPFAPLDNGFIDMKTNCCITCLIDVWTMKHGWSSQSLVRSLTSVAPKMRTVAGLKWQLAWPGNCRHPMGNSAVTGQFADMPILGLHVLWTGQLMDWTSRGLDNSRILLTVAVSVFYEDTFYKIFKTKNPKCSNW